MPNGFEIVTKDNVNGSIIYTLKQMETGCYYAFSHSGHSRAGEGGITQMFVKEDGAITPYCEWEGQ